MFEVYLLVMYCRYDWTRVTFSCYNLPVSGLLLLIICLYKLLYFSMILNLPGSLLVVSLQGGARLLWQRCKAHGILGQVWGWRLALISSVFSSCRCCWTCSHVCCNSLCRGFRHKKNNKNVMVLLLLLLSKDMPDGVCVAELPLFSLIFLQQSLNCKIDFLHNHWRQSSVFS